MARSLPPALAAHQFGKKKPAAVAAPGGKGVVSSAAVDKLTPGDTKDTGKGKPDVLTPGDTKDTGKSAPSGTYELSTSTPGCKGIAVVDKDGALISCHGKDRKGALKKMKALYRTGGK